ncbi:MAG: DUF2092 domain-containing protein [Burkholderiales bacterium]|nr:DUF2092 domain-containing protein [Burkholderiales bacterium]
MHRFFVSSLLSVLCFASLAVAQPAPSQSPDIDNSAIAALMKMRQFLREPHNIYAFTEGTVDRINEAGFLIPESFHSEVWRTLPYHIRLSFTHGENAPREFFFDGKTVTLYDAKNKVYATTSLQGTVGDLFHKLPLYGFELPFTSIYHAPSQQSLPTNIEAFDLGKETVNGIACRHYAYRQRDLDWQMWVPEEGMPLPIRFAAVNRALALRPQFISHTKWEQRGSFDKAIFEFKPPADARRVTLKEIPEKKKVPR